MIDANKEKIIKTILDKEWNLFTNLNDDENKSECQNNKYEFYINRSSQWENLSLEINESYLEDLRFYELEKRNPVFDKYLYMMEFTHKDEYEKMKNLLPVKNEEKEKIIKKIEEIMMEWAKEVYSKYPMFCKKSRFIEDIDKNKRASVRMYLVGEHKTYSYKTNKLYLEYIEKLDYNLVEKIYETIALKKGLGDLKVLEAKLCDELKNNI